MNYTDKYRLPQWEKSDRILMDDFNQAMAAIDAGLTDAVQNGDDAQAAADSAFRPGYLPYATGRYVGNGGTLTINLGFQPSFVIITAQTILTINSTIPPAVAIAGPQGNLINVLRLTSTGMTLIWDEKYSPCVNRSGATYGYVAFR